jgi:hypothetical protein
MHCIITTQYDDTMNLYEDLITAFMLNWSSIMSLDVIMNSFTMHAGDS